MSEGNERSPLAGIESFEAAVFRVGQVARRLLADNPELPVRDLEPTAWTLAQGTAVTAALEITPDSVDGVRAWAKALGGEASVEVRGKGARYRVAKFETEIAGVQVEFTATGAASEDEIAAWRAEQDQAATSAGAQTLGGAA